MEPSRVSAPTGLDCSVLRLLGTGMTTAEVAEQLGLGPDAVRQHIDAAIAALGARSKLEAVVLALRQGLIDLPDRAPERGRPG